ncbi:MAG: Ig-like domain repeat protein, partial [Candidatus Bathyarchaeia archaeon]
MIAAVGDGAGASPSVGNGDTTNFKLVYDAQASRTAEVESRAAATPGSWTVYYGTTSTKWGLVVEAFSPAISTTSSATVSHSAIDQGQSVIITDTVTPSSATGTAAFQVSTNGGGTWSALGSPQTLTGGAASYSYSPSAGNYQYNAVYSGDLNYLTSTSTVASLTVNSAPTVSISSPTGPVTIDAGQSQTFTAATPSGGSGSYTSY